MANTIIQIKRSTTTNVPANGSLSAAEQAYSFLSDKLFIGNTSGTGVVEIGGKYWVDTTQFAYNQANAAFNTANNAASSANANFGAVFLQANTARTHANAAHETANAAFNQANTARTHANTAHETANASFLQANTARTHANTAHLTANAAFDQANTARTHANAAHLTANAAFLQANTARDHANIAFATANSKFSSNGGTITGDVSIVGALTVSGNTTIVNAENLRVSDPLIYLAGNNYSSDIVDIGFIGNYVNATGQNVHTGFYREHEDKMYYLFNGYDREPANNHIGAFSNNMVLAVLNADVRTSNLNLAGVNAVSWIRAAYDQANTARNAANTGDTAASAAFLQANTARTHANAAHLTANAAFDNANAAFVQANTARTHANAAHLTANAAFDQANTARTHANAAFLTANAAFDQANTARNTANTAAANAVNASALTVGTLPSGRLTGSYTGITGVGTLTVGTWNADIIKVPYGGTGVGSFTTNGILYGNNTGDLKVTAAGTEGQVLQASATGVPQFGMLDGGSF